ncbi:MAG: hypothetical protein JWO55_465 [Candidatus Saccharibacteria bacterium]|jgi:hypothetical protein|nr:hypothetical protein [Candidatus Saccharibacteria bacterium]
MYQCVADYINLITPRDNWEGIANHGHKFLNIILLLTNRLSSDLQHL